MNAISRDVAVTYLQSEEWRLKNARRCELIHKKNRGGLSPEERAEFDSLQAESARLLALAHPAPPVDDTLEAAMQAVAQSLGPEALAELQRRTQMLDADTFAALKEFAQTTDSLALAEQVRRSHKIDD